MHSTTDILRFGRPLDTATGALILIHGRGSSAEDIAGLTPAFDAAEFAFLAPSAPGGTWYPQRFLVPRQHNEPSLSTALRTIDDLVGEITAAGIPPAKIGLIGFSQGACLALEHTYRAGRRYGFTAGLSGALIGPLDTPRPPRDLQQTPILLGCASHDAHIPREHVEQSAQTLASMNAAVTKQIYPGASHTVFPDEIAWINDRLKQLAS